MKFLVTGILIVIMHSGYSQTGYKTGEKIKDIPITSSLNFPSPVASISALKTQLTIIDFFGTWCQPCVKALPHLQQLKQQFSSKVSFVLVSNEAEKVLTAFIEKRKPFSLPVVVDNNNLFTKAFVPSSYPYTVVLNSAGQVIALPNTAEMTEENINKWLSDKGENIALNKAPVIKPEVEAKNKERYVEEPASPLVKLSQQFLYAAKTNEPAVTLQQQLNSINYNDLVTELNTDDKKKAFWINIYNGFTQLMLKKDPEKYTSRNKFFKAEQINIAGKVFSLDEIEHGFLRRSKIKWSLGYLNKFFPSKTEKELRVDTLDYRIHFALNCGANSCPPIAFYSAAQIDQQLDVAASSYLKGEAEYDSSKNIVYLPAILSWFRRDFGGKKKIIRLLKQKNILQANADPKISFKKYDWSIYLNNYKN